MIQKKTKMLLSLFHGDRIMTMKVVAILLLLATFAAAAQANLQPDGSCSILSLFPFSDGTIFTGREEIRLDIPSPYGELSRWTADTISMTGFTYTAAMLLAMDHFNNRDASVVPEIADLPEECNVYFSDESTVVDNKLSGVLSGQEIFEASNIAKPCAIVGPYSAVAATWTTPITASLDIPQVFFSAAATIVTEQDNYHNTVRTSLIPGDYVSKILSFLKHQKRDFLAIVHGGSTYDRDLATEMDLYAPLFNITVSLFPLLPPSQVIGGEQTAISAFELVKTSGIRTIFRIFADGGPRELPKLARVADKNSLLEDDYLWILEEHIAPVDDIGTIVAGLKNVSLEMDRLLSGAIVVSPAEAWESGDTDSLFLQSWRALNSSFVDRVNEMVPLTPEQQEYIQGAPDFFQNHYPRRGASFVYDSVMAIGIGACNVQNQNESFVSNATTTSFPDETTPATRESPPPQHSLRDLEQQSEEMSGMEDGSPPENGPPPPVARRTNPHTKGIAQSSFTGVSGRVAFGERGELFRDRVAADVSYGAYNIRPVDESDDTRRYEAILVSRSTPNGWEAIPGKEFIYRDGTSVLSGPPRVIVNENFIAEWARSLGLALMTVAWAVSLTLSFAVWKWKDKQLVRAGQPVFLQVLCLGSFMTSTSILTLSFDESYGWSPSQLSVACTLTPWLFFFGINSMYAGLFCKLWRVDLVTQFRRRQVKAIQAVWPLVSAAYAIWLVSRYI
jgi:hypothetical protein